VWVRAGNVWTTVTRAAPAELTFLAEYLSWEAPEHQRTVAALKAKHEKACALARAEGRKEPGLWLPEGDGKHRLYDGARKRFPSGLLTLVQREARTRSIGVLRDDARTAVNPSGDVGIATWLRPYQQEAVVACVEHKRGVVKMGTGGGKTEVFTALTLMVPCRWVILVTQKDLLDQTAARILARTGEVAGVVGDGRWDEKRITIAMTQTLHDKLDQPRVQALLGSAGGMIVDECHGLGAAREYKVAMACTGAGYRLGFSGSPFARGDKRNAYVIAATGPKIYDLPASDLVEMGNLTKVEAVMVPLRQSIPGGLSWLDTYQQGIVESEPRNRLLVALAKRAQKPALLYVKHLDHGRELVKLLQKAGVPCEFVWGRWKSKERDGAIKRLVRGDAEVLVTNLFEQGTDIPELRDVIVGAGGKSAIKAVQRPGRAMRRSEGKDVARLYDIDDMGQVWLDRHAAERTATYVKEGHRVLKMDAADARLLVMR
jgi:superfamily II DNA or RNA helicase